MAVSVDITNQIISQAWTRAEAINEELQTRLDAAQTAVSGGSSLSAPTPSPIAGIPEPSVSIPLEAQGPDLTLFNEYNDAILGKLTNLFGEYIADYLPTVSSVFSAKDAWLLNQINNGGSGINPEIEAQIVARDRSRILSDADRATDEATAVWSARRFPIPPGALQYQTLQIQQKAQDELAKSSRDVAIKSWEIEVGLIQLAISESVKLRQVAFTSAVEYIKALASSQNTSYQMTMGKSQAQNGLIQAAASFYSARTNAVDTIFKSNFVGAQLQLDASKTAFMVSAQDRHKRGDVAVAAADAVGRQAAAMLNNLHTSVGVQGSEKIA